MEPALIKVAEVATRLKVSVDAVSSYARSGLLPRVKLSASCARYDWHAIKVALATLTVWERTRKERPIISDEIVTREELATMVGRTAANVGLLGRHRLIPRIILGVTCIRYDADAVRQCLVDLLTSKELAGRLKVTQDAVSAMSGRRIPVIRINRRFVRYHWPTVQAALAR